MCQEDHEPFVGAGRSTLKMDITVPAGALVLPGGGTGGAHKAALIDVHVADPTADSHLRAPASSAQHQGAAAAAGVRAKDTHYSPHFDAARFTLYTFALEQFGAAAPHVHQIVGAVANHMVERSGGSWRRGQVVTRWRQRLSIGLHRAVSDSMARNLARTRACPGQPPPQLDAYRHVHLLCTPRGLARSGVPAAADIDAAGSIDVH